MPQNLDDAAAAALWALAFEKNPKHEHIGALYGPDLTRSETVTQDTPYSAGGTLRIPGGAAAIRALFHNHPVRGALDDSQAGFSKDDVSQARKLGVPSYISAGDRVMRYDPRTRKTEEVLAQFPIDEWRAHIMRTLLEREPDDPRGMMR